MERTWETNSIGKNKDQNRKKIAYLTPDHCRSFLFFSVIEHIKPVTVNSQRKRRIYNNMLEINMIYHEDCIECMKRIDDKSIDLICTDLPYQQTHNYWDTTIPLKDYVTLNNKIYYETDIFELSDILQQSIQYTKKWFQENKNIGLWTQYERIIKDNGAIVLFANGMFTADLMKSNPKLWRYNLIWEKTQPTGFLNAKRMPLRSHEDICVFYKNLSFQ